MPDNGFTVTYKVTRFFFDRAEVRRRIGEARVRALGRAGAFVRTRARTAILRRRKTPSEPGQPPSVHSSDKVVTLKNILYAYDPRTDSMVIGPVKLNQVNPASIGGSISVPALLEHGGKVRIEEERYINGTGEWYRRDLRARRRPEKEYRKRTARYARRPFMRPALRAEINAGTISKAWLNSVRG